VRIKATAGAKRIILDGTALFGCVTTNENESVDDVVGGRTVQNHGLRTSSGGYIQHSVGISLSRDLLQNILYRKECLISDNQICRVPSTIRYHDTV
jgi:hypothetical protein